jgi:hypothetical protein
MAQTDRNGGTTEQSSPPSRLNWRGPWATATIYLVYDAFSFEGSSYITIANHTSGVFATDLASGRFQLMAEKGTAGTGTGDLLAANNLSEVNASAARTNLQAALWDVEGASVVAASTTDIWALDGTTRHITGNTTITSFGTAPRAGARMRVIFDGTPLLTHSTDCNLNNGTDNIQIEVGDYADVYADTTTQMDVIVHRKSGKPIVRASDTAYGTGWNGDLDPPTKNAVYDKIETLGGGFSNMQVFTSTDTWEVPAGVTKVKATVVGGGGSGGGGTLGPTIGQMGGGGGGATAIGIYTVVPSAVHNVTVGTAGNASSFGSPTAFCTATGGASAANDSVVGGAGGIATGGQINIRGGVGRTSGGEGGDSFYSQGAPSPNTANSNGVSAVGFGAGGSGARDNNSTISFSGGAGVAGVVVLEW